MFNMFYAMDLGLDLDLLLQIYLLLFRWITYEIQALFKLIIKIFSHKLIIFLNI